jgi:CheY-like chemotaxis protein
MDNKFKILISDRNPNILDFIKRELDSDIYEIKLTKNGGTILNSVISDKPPDLIVLDLDLQSTIGGYEVLEALNKLNKTIPIIIHSYNNIYTDHDILTNTSCFIEKKRNLEELKVAIYELLKNYYPTKYFGITLDHCA